MLEEALVCKKVVDQSVKDGVALAILGGGHHAEHARPYGFCTVNTMSIAAVYASKQLRKSITLIDLDVHYSNGCFDTLKDIDNVWVSSIWSKKVDKWKYFKADGNIWHKKVNTKKEYFYALRELIENHAKFKPEFVIYHLGMDVLEVDRMGGIPGFTYENLYERERMISYVLKSLKVPYVIFLGGAYIDHSKGEKFVASQKRTLTDCQYKSLSFHN